MTEHAYPLDDAAAPRISDGLTQLAAALRQRSWHDATALGLSATQVQILVFLHRHARDAAKLSEVARILGLTSATVSDAVSTLEAKGHVHKGRDPGNARALALSITGPGRLVAEQVTRWPDVLLAGVETLTPDEQTVFVRGLSKIIGEMERQGAIPVARLCVTCANFRPNMHADSARPHHCVLIDAPLGDHGLRLDCAEHEEAALPGREATWQRWLDIEQLR
ncbi:MarR family winged helix-turn-helix transcriptional regulator [Deinococcus humi]|uniref:DNA-binding MarR family transcriptional regulator n=1 Tax=Deinococcus humi TaxID=662880 RepID=A0A7W8JUT1_9DEIO|nr:MarR family transcriptional regulator [Deinococcus humi]MBB5363627.1 DNA-binding MarR family transcriptional regulator [Deinococcus humi]GGO29995.1 transcriptional regulator [Deinococcus humi]